MMKRTSTGSRDESYEHVLMCLICRSLFDDYDHQPKFLPCHHTFCKDCLREYCRQIGDEIECPSCRKIANIPAAGVAALQTNFYVKYIQSLVSGGTGQSCHALECSKHAEEKLQFYCTDCEQSICKECCREDGLPCLSHDKVPITKITEESHQKLDSSFSLANATIEEKKVKLEKALKALAEEKDSALLRIDSTFEQHAHTLTRRATLLKNKVIDIYNENVEQLENDLMEISTALTCIVSLKDYHEDKIAHGDYKEFSKGIEEIEEVDKNITDRIHPAETHIMFEGSHGSEKYRACAKDLGRVKFNRRVSMPRTEPEGNDSAEGSAQASGLIPPSPTESPKHDSSPLTPSTPTHMTGFGQCDDPQSPVRTTDRLGEPAERCLPGSGFCDSTPSMLSPTEAGGVQLDGESVAAGTTVMKTSMKSSMTRSSMTESQSSKLTKSKVCDVKLSNTSINNISNQPTQACEKTKMMHTSPPKSQLTATKPAPVQHNPVINSIKDETVKEVGKLTQQLKSSQKKKHPPQVSPEQSKVVPSSSNSSNTSSAAVFIPNGGKGRTRNLTVSQKPSNPAVQGKGTGIPSNSPPQTQSAVAMGSKNNPAKSSKEAGVAASGVQQQASKPSRLPGLSGMCRIPKPRGASAKGQTQKGSGSLGFVRRSPTGQRLSPSGQSSQRSGAGNLRTNGNNPSASNQTMLSARNANGNITMQPIPEGTSVINANDSDKTKAEKEYYHLLYTSYDEEELLKELKSGKANLDDTDSWMTISSGDESNNTNSSDDVLAEADQTTF